MTNLNRPNGRVNEKQNELESSEGWAGRKWDWKPDLRTCFGKLPYLKICPHQKSILIIYPEALRVVFQVTNAHFHDCWRAVKPGIQDLMHSSSHLFIIPAASSGVGCITLRRQQTEHAPCWTRPKLYAARAVIDESNKTALVLYSKTDI